MLDPELLFHSNRSLQGGRQTHPRHASGPTEAHSHGGHADGFHKVHRVPDNDLLPAMVFFITDSHPETRETFERLDSGTSFEKVFVSLKVTMTSVSNFISKTINAWTFI